jgi:hypothetical protein
MKLIQLHSFQRPLYIYSIRYDTIYSYPYGCMHTSIAQIMIIVAWSLSLLTISSCYFVNARPIPEDNAVSLSFLGYGFMVTEGGGDGEVFGKCGRYSDFQQEQHIEVAWQFATAFGFLAILIGGLVALILLTTCCLSFHDKRIFHKLAMVTTGCFVLQILVFCAYGNSLLCGGTEPDDYICNWGSGSGLNLGAALLWLLSAFLIKLWPVPDDPIPQRDLEEPTPMPPPPKQPAKLPMLTNGQKPPPKNQELPTLTNGSPKRHRVSTNNKMLANEPHKPKRPPSRPSNNLAITNGNSSTSQALQLQSPKGGKDATGRRSRRVLS